MKTVAKNFGLALIILLMAATAFTFLAPRFGWSVDAVFSGSMEPELKVGSMVITRPVEPEKIRAGDIITFYSPLSERLTSHRVIAVEQASPLHFLTKGDANEDADPFVVPARNVVGKVCLHISYFGYIIQFVKTPLGFLLTICVPGLIVIITEAKNLWRVLTEEKIGRQYRAR